MKQRLVPVFSVLWAVFWVDCSFSEEKFRLTQGRISLSGKSAYLGDPINNWKRQFGPTDTAGLTWEKWSPWGLRANLRKNACGEERVTCVSIKYRSYPDLPTPTTRLPIQLEGCEFHWQDTIKSDTIKCSRADRSGGLTFIRPPGDTKFWFESNTIDIVLDTDSARHLMQLQYCLSSENAFLVGLERSPEDAKAFVDSGGCGKIPDLWNGLGSTQTH